MAHAAMPRLLEVRSTDVGSAEDRPPCDTTRKLKTVLSDVPASEWCQQVQAALNLSVFYQNDNPPQTCLYCVIHCRFQDWFCIFQFCRTQACATMSSTCPRSHGNSKATKTPRLSCELSAIGCKDSTVRPRAGKLRWFHCAHAGKPMFQKTLSSSATVGADVFKCL